MRQCIEYNALKTVGQDVLEYFITEALNGAHAMEDKKEKEEKEQGFLIHWLINLERFTLNPGNMTS